MPTPRQHYHSMLLPACNGTERQVKDEKLAVGVHGGANGQFEDVNDSHAFDMKPKHDDLGDRPMESAVLKRQLEDAGAFHLNHSDLTCRQRQTLIGQTVRLRGEKDKLRAQGSPSATATANVFGANTSFRQLPKQLVKQSMCTIEESCVKSKALQRTFGDVGGNGRTRMHSCEVCSIGDLSTSNEASSPVPSAASMVSLDGSVSMHDQSLQQLHNICDDIWVSKAELLDRMCSRPSSLGLLRKVYRENHSMNGTASVTPSDRLVREQKCHGICNHSGSIRVSENDFMEIDQDVGCSRKNSHIHLSPACQENAHMSCTAPMLSLDGIDEQWEWRKHRILDIQDHIRLRDAKISERRSRRQTFECVD